MKGGIESIFHRATQTKNK